MRLLDGVDQRVDYATPFRLYDVRLGRWTSSDPIFDPSASSYEGLWSNPLAFTDPLGLVPGGENGASTPLAPGPKKNKETIRSDDRSIPEKLAWQYAVGLWNGGLNEYYDNINQVVEMVKNIPSALENMTMEDVERAFSQLPGLIWEGIKAIPDVLGDAANAFIELASAGNEAGDILDVARGKVSMYEAAERKGRRDAMRIKLLVEYALLRGGGKAFSAAIRMLPREMRVAAWKIWGKAIYSTKADEAVFWSGIQGSEVAAREWAVKHGGKTLEMTIMERGVKLPEFDPNNPAVIAEWRSVSAQFAGGASGDVRVLQGPTVRVNSVWAQVEFPALKANPKVTSVTAIDPVTGRTTLIWRR